jgi:iron transport multicopper oxidase
MALVCGFALGGPAGAGAAGITNSGGDLRDGWYPNQPRLAPDAVSSSTFGQLWKAQLDGQIYAQPLVHGDRVIVATERNVVASLDAETGATKWSKSLGAPFPYTLIGWGCSDLTPDLGITATPVIDATTNTIYLTHKTYAAGSTTQAAYWMDALDADTGVQRTGFPKLLSGTAQNAPGVTFEATTELQRPGLLLLDGVVYAGFGGHCDIGPYQGWVFGVNAANGQIKARWSAVTSGDGAGIWQSGAGLMSDGPGRIYVSTGNGGSPQGPSDTPSGMFGESIVRLAVQSDGTLQTQDFFAPADAEHLDTYDADFASGGVTALRDDVFGTTTYPHVAVAVGKAGYVYLLDRDDLGGIQMGTGRGDDVIQRVGPYGGVWSRPGVWPGDGGWVAIPTASPGGGEHPDPSGSAGFLKLYKYRKAANGTPSLDSPIQSDDAFGFGSGAPIITSDGTTSGSAVLWIVWSPNGSGYGAQLRAYDAVPKNGKLNLRRSWPIGVASKFSMPGIGAGRTYVGTREGEVYAYGAPVKAEVQAPATTFPVTTVGQTSTAQVKLTVSGTVKLNGVSAAPSAFAAKTTGLGLPKTLTDGQTLTVPVDFTPTATGSVGGVLTVSSDKGTFTFSMTGVGQAEAALLTAWPPVVSFGGAVVGDVQAGTVTFGNSGGQPLTITGVEQPAAPFSVDAAPAPGTVIAPGDALNVTVHYRPTAVGDFNDDLVVATTAGTKTVGLSGSAGIGPKLSVSPSDGWQYGSVVVGQSATTSVVVKNTGDSTMTITKSKPPANAAFQVLDALDEASQLTAGQSKTLRVKFTPTAPGTVTDAWTINAGDGTGVRTVALSGRGIAPAHLTGPSSASVGDVVLGSAGATAVTFGNDGELPLTVTGFDQPDAPFSVGDAPAPGTTIAAGGSLTVYVAFSSLAPGPAAGALTLRTSAGDKTVTLGADVVTAGVLEATPVDFAAVALGASATRGLTLRNAGSEPLKVLASAPPADPRFVVVEDVPAGLTLAPGQERTFAVRFTPVAAEASTAYWGLSTTAEAGTRMVPLVGRGEAPAVVTPPVIAPPVVLPPAVLPPVDVPRPPGVVPGVVSEGAPAAPAKVRPGLTVSKPKVSRDGRTLSVRGFVAKAATGGLKVRLEAKTGRKTTTSVATIALRGKSTYAGTLVLPKAARAWTRLEVQVAFAGNSRVWPGAGGYVLVRPRAR